MGVINFARLKHRYNHGKNKNSYILPPRIQLNFRDKWINLAFHCLYNILGYIADGFIAPITLMKFELELPHCIYILTLPVCINEQRKMMLPITYSSSSSQIRMLQMTIMQIYFLDEYIGWLLSHQQGICSALLTCHSPKAIFGSTVA